MPPEEIKLSALFRILEGPIALLPCVSLNFYQKCEDCDEIKCGINKIMATIRDSTLEVLNNNSINNLSLKNQLL